MNLSIARSTTYPALMLAALLAAAPASAGTRLAYERTGSCTTEFDTMTMDGLHARVDMDFEGMRVSTLYDDDERLMHTLLHMTRNVVTMESDDDAVDFQGDVGKSSLIAADKQAEALTGMDQDATIALFRAQQVQTCPDLADKGVGDPDYAEAAMRCAERMSAQVPALDPAPRRGAKGRRRHADQPVQPPAPEAVPLVSRTTTTDRDAGHDTVDGIACTVERTRRGDAVLQEDCVTPLETLGVEASAMRRLRRMVTIGQGLGDGIASLTPQLAEPRRAPTIALRRTCYRDGREAGTATLRIDTTATIDAATFAIPQGYTPIMDGTRDVEHGVQLRPPGW